MSISFVWVDDSVEHTDHDHDRAAALAAKWSSLMYDREDKHFRALSDEDNGYNYQCECDFCTKSNHDCDTDGVNESCSLCSMVTNLTRCEWEERQAVQREEQALEIELVEDKLADIGARMMRPYEHWNEDERYIEYMETRYDNEY